MMDNFAGIRSTSNEGYLEGQLLIAMPSLKDKWFARSVIYLCSHTKDGAMGLIVNYAAPEITFPDLVEQLDIAEEDDEIGLATGASDFPVNIGGPVETGRGFVLHSSDYFVDDATLKVGSDICLTATIDILKSMMVGEGPARALLALGYSGWAPGQLDAEIQANGWLHCEADEALVFGQPLDAKYDLALTKLGIDPGFLVSDFGHA